METRTVPDDLERNVELPLTEAGGRFNDEAHMTDEEKAHVAQYEENGVTPQSKTPRVGEQPTGEQPTKEELSEEDKAEADGKGTADSELAERPPVNKMVKGAPNKK